MKKYWLLISVFGMFFESCKHTTTQQSIQKKLVADTSISERKPNLPTPDTIQIIKSKSEERIDKNAKPILHNDHFSPNQKQVDSLKRIRTENKKEFSSPPNKNQ